MTTFVSQRVATPTVSPRRIAGSLGSARTWVGARTRGFRAAAEYQRSADVSPLALKLFAVD